MEIKDEGEQVVGSLAAFLIARSCGNAKIATALFWHLSVERSCGGQHSLTYKRVHLLLCQRLQSARVPSDLGLQPAAGSEQGVAVEDGGDSAGFFDMDRSGGIGGVRQGEKGGASREGNALAGRGASLSQGKPLLIDVLRRQEHFVAALGGLVAGVYECVCTHTHV